MLAVYSKLGVALVVKMYSEQNHSIIYTRKVKKACPPGRTDVMTAASCSAMTTLRGIPNIPRSSSSSVCNILYNTVRKSSTYSLYVAALQSAVTELRA